MALTHRTDGIGGGLVSSGWWNDYFDLLTGTMSDQPVTLKNGMTVQAVTYTTPTAPTLAVVSGGSVDVGAHTYAVTFTMGNGETIAGTTSAATTTSTNKTVNLTVIPTGPTGTTARNIYRSAAGTTTPLLLLHTLSDNTTTTYSDTTADAGLGASAPAHDSFGGYLQVRNAAGTVVAEIYNDGSVSFESGNIGSDGAGNWTAEGYSFTHAPFSGTSNAFQLGRQAGNSTGYINWTNSSGGIGFMVAATKKAEIRNNGNFVVSGTQFQTTSGSVSTASGQTFDAFDVAEVYPTDKAYTQGTVVCPKSDGSGLLTRCTHDNCPCAMVVSPNPGLCLGSPNDPGETWRADYDDSRATQQAIAISGRVNVKTAFVLPPRTFVVSDGRGGVRAAAPGEQAHCLGYTLNRSEGAQVGIVLKAVFGVVV
jgi:hypothetical protein